MGLPAKVLRERCRQSNGLFARLMRLAQRNQIDTSMNATCHLRHLLAARLASWLLAAQAHTRENELAVTQTDVADRLGVHRTSVVEAFARLVACGDQARPGEGGNYQPAVAAIPSVRMHPRR